MTNGEKASAETRSVRGALTLGTVKTCSLTSSCSALRRRTSSLTSSCSARRYTDFLMNVAIQNTKLLDIVDGLPKLSGIKPAKGLTFSPESLRLLAMLELRKSLSQVRWQLF